MRLNEQCVRMNLRKSLCPVYYVKVTKSAPDEAAFGLKNRRLPERKQIHAVQSGVSHFGHVVHFVRATRFEHETARKAGDFQRPEQAMNAFGYLLAKFLLVKILTP